MLCVAGVLVGLGGSEGRYDRSRVVPNEDRFREGHQGALRIQVEGLWLTCEHRLIPHRTVSAVVVHMNRNHGRPRQVPQFLPGGPVRHQRGATYKIRPTRNLLHATASFISVHQKSIGVAMGKSITDIDLIWVIPKVKDLEYPPGDSADPIEAIIFGEPYLIEVETHTSDNITYIILDSLVFRAQTKADPYPARMDDLSSAIFYSTWNQAIAAAVQRYPDVDIYHINNYHGALVPIYLLPKVPPVCLSLHNAEFQGLWCQGHSHPKLSAPLRGSNRPLLASTELAW